MEWFQVFDCDGWPVGFATRPKCHACPALFHKVAHVIVTNSLGHIYLQKRARHKDIQPGKWDTSVGGHFDLHESPLQAARRETYEELKISAPNFKFLYQYLWQSDRESEIVHTFLCYFDGQCVPCPNEIEAGRWWFIADIKANLQKNIFTPNFEIEFNKYLSFISA